MAKVDLSIWKAWHNRCFFLFLGEGVVIIFIDWYSGPDFLKFMREQKNWGAGIVLGGLDVAFVTEKSKRSANLHTLQIAEKSVSGGGKR